MTAPLEVGRGLSFQARCPEVLLFFPEVSSPKRIWGGVDVAARQRVPDRDLEATLGHMLITTNDLVRPMRADAAPRPLHYSPGTEEEIGLLVIYVKEHHRDYKLDH